jgi:hypothetical protein
MMYDTDLIDLWKFFLVMLKGPVLLAQEPDNGLGLFAMISLVIFYTGLASPFMLLWAVLSSRWRARHPHPVPPSIIDPTDRFIQDVEAYLSARYQSPPGSG